MRSASFILTVLLVSSCGYVPPTSPDPAPNPNFDFRGVWVGTWTAPDGVTGGPLKFKMYRYESTPGQYYLRADLDAHGASCSSIGNVGDGYFTPNYKTVSIRIEVRDDTAAEDWLTSPVYFEGEFGSGVLTGTFRPAFTCQFCGCDWQQTDGADGTWSVRRQ